MEVQLNKGNWNTLMAKIWTIMPHGNRMLESADKTFYISFQADYFNPLGMADTMDGETAIVIREPEQYFILNGDWREQYEKLIDQGLYACIAFYNSHKFEWSSFTNELPVKLLKESKNV
jgi:hypothetical protein